MYSPPSPPPPPPAPNRAPKTLPTKCLKFPSINSTQIILVKPVTSLASDMCKMAFKAGYISPPTHPTPTRCTLECALVMCNAICGIMAGAQEIETLSATSSW